LAEEANYDTLIHRATINRKYEIMCLDLLAILDQDAKSTMFDLAYIGKCETYTRIYDICRVGILFSNFRS
jgi:hypothetical protein